MSRKSRYSGKHYMALLRKRQRLKRSGKTRAWHKLGLKASAYRKRMIAANKGRKRRRCSKKILTNVGVNRSLATRLGQTRCFPHASGGKKRRYNAGHTTGKMQPCQMSEESKRWHKKLLKTEAGRAVNSLFKKFFKLSCPPTIRIVPGDGKKAITPLMVMGGTKEAFISTGNKGERGKQTKTIKGNWIGATERSGKHVILLANNGARAFEGGLKFVGYAPRTDYVLTPDIEKAGSHKSGYHWKHIHGAKDGKNIPLGELEWPRVYADRNGKVDGDSNFVYGTTKHGRITDWMYH